MAMIRLSGAGMGEGSRESRVIASAGPTASEL
jgi:hypothetical protein